MRNQSSSSSPKFIANIGLLVLPQPFTDHVPKQPIKTLESLWIRIDNGKISEIGPKGEPFPVAGTLENMFDAKGRLAAPGLIDSHTHPVFNGWRQAEFLRRCRGDSYQQIAAEGGGILSTVRGVRAASVNELKHTIKGHLDRFLEMGVTTIEGKSGYGLSVQDEVKSLTALIDAADAHPIDISPTLLAAHVIPPEYKTNPDKYVILCCEEIIPAVCEAGLAESVDLFLDDGAFNSEQTRQIFQSAIDHNLQIRIHADQFCTGDGAALAAEFKAISADHMDYTSERGFAALSEAGVSLNLLPGAVFFLGLDQYASARTAIDCGCSIALSTDFNPGSSPTQSLPLMMTLACLKMGLTADEALWACTMGGARILNRHDSIGTLDVGYQADLCLWDAPNAAFIPYSYANLTPEFVFKNGKLVAKHGKINYEHATN